MDQLNRFIASVESIAASLAVIASGQQTLPLAAGTAGTAATSATPATDTKPAGRGKAAKAEAPKTEAAPAAGPAKTEAPKVDVPTFDYEVLKKAIIALASAGAEGKEEALRILTDAGVEKGGKASDAPPAKWKAMHDDAVASLAKINAGAEFA